MVVASEKLKPIKDKYPTITASLTPNPPGAKMAMMPILVARAKLNPAVGEMRVLVRLRIRK
ncbi:MAG: hypothetical protein WEB89_12415 [Balneolales bacterium]